MSLMDELRSDPTKCNTISCCLLAICILLIMIMFLVVHGNLHSELQKTDADLKSDRATEKKMGFFAYLGSLFHHKKKKSTKPAATAPAATAPATAPAATSKTGFLVGELQYDGGLHTGLSAEKHPEAGWDMDQ